MTKEQDKQIAEKVMGWKWLDRKAKGWGDGPDVYGTEDEINPTFQDFRPTTEADHDYLVLKHIRENWGGGRLWLFDGSLVSGWVKGNPNERQIELPKYYEPGDYSLAALRVLSDEING